MIKLENNQRVLYQWSLNQRVIVDGFLSGTKVEFSDKYDCKDSALPTVAYQEGEHVYADIPNILLQSPKYIRVLVCPSAADAEHLPEEKDIKVVRRDKPEDYVYTETPTLTLDSKVDKYWGEENKGKALAIGDDGCVTAAEPIGGISASVIGETLILKRSDKNG
jgi:hypothetical protein